jgi:hypothetical protein
MGASSLFRSSTKKALLLAYANLPTEMQKLSASSVMRDCWDSVSALAFKAPRWQYSADLAIKTQSQVSR